MTLMRWLGLVLFVGALPIGLWLTYVQRFVHPEFTRPQMLWAYPWHYVAVTLMVGSAVTIFERTWRRAA